MEEKKHGGARVGAGRKPKADEAKLIERLDNIIDSDDVIKQLLSLVKDGDFRATIIAYNVGPSASEDVIDRHGDDYFNGVMRYYKKETEN